MEFVPRQRRSTLDPQTSSDLAARQRRESLDTAEISNHWRHFLQRNREFVNNKEKALESKRKTKQEDLDKSCTFAPKVQDWGLKVDDPLASNGDSSTSCSEVAQSKIEADFLGACQQELQDAVNRVVDIRMTELQDAVERVVTSRSRDESDDAPKSAADLPKNNVTAEVSGTCCTGTLDRTVEPTLDESKAVDPDQHHVSETLLVSNLPLQAWKEEEEDRVATVDCSQGPGPAKLSCSPSGKLVVSISNMASEVTLHDNWPRAKLLFTGCDDECEKKLPIGSSNASTEVSNCPSESGGPDNDDDDDLDSLVAHLRSHKVYSYRFSG